MPSRAAKRAIDNESALSTTRVFLHFWPLFAAAGSLTPHFTEARLFVDFGLPYWSLGACLFLSGLILITGRSLHFHFPKISTVLLAVGDFYTGTLCLMMAALMGIAASHGQASMGSSALWLIGALFILHGVLRTRR